MKRDELLRLLKRVLVLIIMPMMLLGCFATQTFYIGNGAIKCWVCDKILLYQDSTLVVESLLPQVYGNGVGYSLFITPQGKAKIYIKNLEVSVIDGANEKVNPITGSKIHIGNTWIDHDKISYSEIPDSCKHISAPELLYWNESFNQSDFMKRTDLSFICYARIIKDGKEIIINRKINIYLKKRLLFNPIFI